MKIYDFSEETVYSKDFDFSKVKLCDSEDESTIEENDYSLMLEIRNKSIKDIVWQLYNQSYYPNDIVPKKVPKIKLFIAMTTLLSCTNDPSLEIELMAHVYDDSDDPDDYEEFELDIELSDTEKAQLLELTLAYKLAN